MLVSHESPISILDASQSYNDYDYALVHLFETHPEYYNFFKCSLAAGREVLLDNSIFELGESFDPNKYRKYAEELNPTFYIVPDVLEDSAGTMSSWMKFIANGVPDINALKIGVVQGDSYQELVECYKFMSDNADYIAISFDYKWYNRVSLSNRPGRLGHLDRWCAGRQHLIKRLMDDGIWDKTRPHHLLGASLAREFSAYVDFADEMNIRSLDTSNPVVAGLTGHRYVAGTGLNHKPSVMLADLISKDVDEDTWDDIQFNTYEFKNIIGR
tara:strand:+ start:14758 stop:15570 length:813 start_codon:yes stop_codon:yes gene_type:complete